MPKEGDRFGNWIIERTLDRGGMGMVYQAYNPDLGKSEKVALKVLDPAVAERNADFVKRFYREASIVFKTRCPNLVSIHDAGRDAASGFYYIVMEYLGGGTLRDRMRRQGPMPWREALSIIRPVALALAAVAKRKSVHRDIKPENIMFTADGEVKLADFGIAKAAQDDSEDMLKTMPAQVFGTPSYMSPEQVKDASSVDARADIWSLGVVLFEMLAGVRPYPARSIVEVAAFLLSPRPFPDIRTFKAPEAHGDGSPLTAVTMATQPTMATQATCSGAMPASPADAPGSSSRRAALDIPDAVAGLLSRMCEKNLAKRIATSEDVVSAIDRILGRPAQSDPAPAPGPGPVPSPAPHPGGGRGRGPLRIACMVLSLFLIALCVFAFLRKSPAPIVRDPGPPVTNADSPVDGPKPSPRADVTVVTSLQTNLPPKPQELSPLKPQGLSPREPTPQGLSPKPPSPKPSVPQVVLFRPQKGSIEDVLSQLDRTISQRPIRLKVSLSAYATGKDMSVERFEQQLLTPAIERLRTSGVSFSLVPGPGKYGSAVQDMAKRFGCELE